MPRGLQGKAESNLWLAYMIYAILDLWRCLMPVRLNLALQRWLPIHALLSIKVNVMTRLFLKQIMHTQVQEIEEDILTLLLPKDRTDDRGVILEVRAGTGGEEAALFAADLFNMYQRFSEQQRWKFEVYHFSLHSCCPHMHLHSGSMLAWQSCGACSDNGAD